jgi:hypothetical protein
MAASMMMCLKALGHACDEDEVNKVMGATPMKGAAWEHALATAQHYGCRATLTSPATVSQLKAWTDKGNPVMIAWNPEGRDWSHASVVFDVDDDGNVHVADPNIPDPEETVRVVPKADFYKMWYEKWPNYLVRRPAMAIEREITPEGKQVMASRQKSASRSSGWKFGPGRAFKEFVGPDGKVGEVFIDQSRGQAKWSWERDDVYAPDQVIFDRVFGQGGRLADLEDLAQRVDDWARATGKVASSKAAATKTDSQGKTWGPKRGLEGPFRYRSGIVLYWDPREGHYYDPSSDRYLYDDREFLEVTGEFWDRKASASRVASRAHSSKR